MSAEFRYPGAKPFEQGQEHLFFGRTEDTTKLARKVKLAPLTVLYGKSGLGKSSLLNAGLIPQFVNQEYYTCLRIRFNAWQEQQDNSSPLNITLEQLAGLSNNNALSPLIAKEHSLWRQVKEHTIAEQGEKPLLLIFDQFEELFTYPEEEIRQFRQQLSEMLYTPAPQRYWDALEENHTPGSQGGLSREVLQLFQADTMVKVVFAIRSDRIHLLERLSDYIPLILKNLYELAPLDEQNARSAITEPAFLKGKFATPRFTYAPEAMADILSYLTDQGTAPIESTQLQIICHHLEGRIAATDAFEITQEEVTQLDQVIENYYEERIGWIEDKTQAYAARRLIEEGLVFEEEERRLSIYEGQALKSFGLSSATLRLLVDSHLLRAEPSLRGGYTYELSHDTMVKPVLKAKVERITAEKAAAQKIAQQARAAERLEERKKRRRAYLIAICGAVLALVALTAAWWAIRQSNAAEKARYELSLNAYELQWALANTLKVEGRYEEALAALSTAQNYLSPEDIHEKNNLSDTLSAWAEVKELVEQANIKSDLFELGAAYSLIEKACQLSNDASLENNLNSLRTQRETAYYEYLEEARGLLNLNKTEEAQKTIKKMEELDFLPIGEIYKQLKISQQ